MVVNAPSAVAQPQAPEALPPPVQPPARTGPPSTAIPAPRVAQPERVPDIRFIQPAEDYEREESEATPLPSRGEFEEVPSPPRPEDLYEQVPAASMRPGDVLDDLRWDAAKGWAEPIPQPETPLTLAEVIDSVNQHYPLLFAVEQLRGIRSGEALSRWGAFDTKLEIYSENTPMGYYQTYRQGAKVEVPTWMGGSVLAGYKRGTGYFEPWYGYRETNEGGEFAGGFTTPLWRNRPIDDRRTNLRVAQLGRDLAEPEIYAKRIEFYRKSSIVYWKWVASGQAYRIHRDLLRIAELRDDALARRVETGDVAPVERTDNRRVIAQRQGKLIMADRYFQKAAIELSLFVRDRRGDPQMPLAARLPDFPPIGIPDAQQFDNDVQTAFRMRPELQDLNLQRQQAEVILANARNHINPGLDANMLASKDAGAEVADGSKTPFQLDAGLVFEMPVQRRKAWGMVRTQESKIAQINAKQRYVRDEIVAQVQDAFSALNAAYQQWVRAREVLHYAREVERLERRNFELGNSTILIVQLREQATVDAALAEVESLLEYFAALADYRAAIAIPNPALDGR